MSREGKRRNASALHRGIFPATLLLLLLPAGATAHHIMGIPHYAYDENYPQAPVLKLLETVGEWEFQLTSYPGNPEPGERTQINLYIVSRTDGVPYRLPVTLTIREQGIFGGNDLVFGPDTKRLDENVFKFYPVYPAEGNYEVVLSFQDGAVVSTLRFPMVVGHPGSPWTPLLAFGGGLALFLVAIRAARIKMARRRGAEAERKLEEEETA